MVSLRRFSDDRVGFAGEISVMTDRMRGYRAWIDDRRLAGDNRAGSWARAEARRRQLRFVRDSWRWLAAAVVAATAFTAGVAWLAPAGFWRGLAVGGVGTSAIATLFVLLIEVTGTAAVSMGSTAEQWTASELRPLRKQGWVLINRFLLDRGGDIDHLLIGPAGIVVAETKWRSSGWTLRPPAPEVREAMQRVSRSAHRIGNWDPVKKAGCPVQPVLFLWGRRADEPAEATREYLDIGPVAVIRGTRAAAHWRERAVRADRMLADPVVAALAREIREHLRKRDEHEAARQTVPPTFQRLYWTASGCCVVGVTGMMAMIEPLSHRLDAIAVVVAAIAVALGIYLRRFRAVKLFADAWLAGVVGVGVLALVLVAVV